MTANAHHRTAIPPKDLTVGGRMTTCACARSRGPHHLPRRNHPLFNGRIAMRAALASLACPSTRSLSFPGASLRPSGHDERSNPHRLRNRDLHPAGSFPGGFRTPAPVHVAIAREGRHPKPFT